MARATVRWPLSSNSASQKHTERPPPVTWPRACSGPSGGGAEDQAQVGGGQGAGRIVQPGAGGLAQGLVQQAALLQLGVGFAIHQRAPRAVASAAAEKSRGPLNDKPPSTGMMAPVMKLPQSLASHWAMWAMSLTWPRRRRGTRCAIWARVSAVGARRLRPSVSAIGPGTMELTRMPCGPHSMASTWVSMSTPALAAQTWAW